MGKVHSMNREEVNSVETKGPSTEIALPMKPFFAMTDTEKKAYRRGNRKRFVALGYGLVVTGGGALISGIDLLNGDSMAHLVHSVAGFEIITTATFVLVAGLAHVLALVPWEDA